MQHQTELPVAESLESRLDGGLLRFDIVAHVHRRRLGQTRKRGQQDQGHESPRLFGHSTLNVSLMCPEP